MSLLRMLRTVRHLRPVQIYGRIAYRLRRSGADTSPPPPVRRLHRAWRQPALHRQSFFPPDDFVLLNHRARLRDAGAWNDPALPRLFVYNLHYFADLTADGATQRQANHRALVHRWIEENPPGMGAGWEPYPLSLRIVNWVKWALAGVAGGDANVQASLAVQVRCLEGQLERHILGNHLWANAKALVFAGLFFSGAEGERWLRAGLDLVDGQLREQILPDGGHFERTPMYHAIVLEDVLDLINLAMMMPDIPVSLTARLRETAPRMLRWLRIMSHPDGGIAFFNDAAFGIAAEYDALSRYAQSLGLGRDDTPLGAVEALSDSGYVRLENGPAVAICDVGPIGPDYQPGHAHADTLSFELSLGGQRIVVNGGTSTYADDAERARQRGTRAHSTVVVDGADSSEVWSAFRVARRARPFGVAWECRDGSATLQAAHDGYRRLAGRVTHHREWRLSSDALLIKDRLEGRPQIATAVFPLHPDVRVVDLPGETHGVQLFRCDEFAAELSVTGAGPLTVSATTWHPEFGRAVAARRIEAKITGRDADTSIRWA